MVIGPEKLTVADEIENSCDASPHKIGTSQ
jgi:hypothetical protein